VKNYRPEIDGLRSLAIVPILLFHADFALFSGGYIGVDIFFVISGYLITGIILNEINDHKFRLIHFYERRARRILPNLLFVIIFSTLISWFFLSIYDLQSFGKSLLGVATFSSNIYFWLQSGYFSESTELIPLIHTWSLSVEEQFYLFFPILISFSTKLNKKKLFYVIIFLTFCSLFLSIWAVNYVNPIHQKIVD
jgi:peptidoglycan/LPS O-acetylase OafA/YrhL